MASLDLYAQCSRYFTFADLIECGETWRRLDQQGRRVPNLPLRDETLVGLQTLAQRVLDPLWDRFGRIEITYGFAGPALTRHIPRYISPPHDQHAGSEMSATGKQVCPRGGQACDLRAESADALAVLEWVRTNVEFDRLYLYGRDRPIHVSVGPEAAGKVYAMRQGSRGRLPRDVTPCSADEIATLLAANP